MVGSTAAPLPSPHPDRPAGVDGRSILMNNPPLSSSAGVSSTSTSTRTTSSMCPILSSKNKGSLPSVEIAAQAHLQDQHKIPAKALLQKVSCEEICAATHGRTQDPSQEEHKGPAKSLPEKLAAPTHGRSQDPSQDQQKRLAKAVPKKRVKTPVLPVVGSPGVNLLLSQGSPRTIGVKRSSPIPSQFSGLFKCQCIRHLLVCEERAKINEFLNSMKSAMPNNSEEWKYDPNRAQMELVRLIVLHELPFRIVEYEGFMRFVRSLNPAFELVCRTKIRHDCIAMFDYQKIKLREILQGINSRVSLTADMWTSRQVVSYMCITCLYINDKWKLRKKVIRFSEANTPHDGTNLFNIMLECMQDWGLQDKIFSITLDNASNNNSCVSYMQANLLGKNLLPCKGDLLHGRCGAHVINLVVQDGLAITCMAVDKIRESVKYVRSSPPWKKKFKDIVVQEGIKCTKKVYLDVPTHWNSTHLMIKTALEYRKAFAALKLQDLSYTCLPTSDEWETAKSVCNLLEVFLDATMVVSSTLYPTSHLYFHELWKIYLTLEREAKNEEAAIRSMVVAMPLDQTTKYLTRVKKTFKDLFTEYSSHEDDSTLENNQGMNNAATIDNPWEQWNKQAQEEQQNRAKLTELNIYLKDDVHPQEDGFDILWWWSANAHKYPIISRIAKDVLAAPVSTVASESAFSTGGRILSDYRSHMLGETVESLICLQDWMRPSGTTYVNTITSDVVHGKRADIYGPSEDIFEH